MKKIIQLALTLTFGGTLLNMGCQSSGSKRSAAVTELISRGDKFLALGNQSEAFEAWSFVLAHDSANLAANEKLLKIKEGGQWMLTAEEVDRTRELFSELIGSITEKDLCKFSSTSATMETTNLRMLADTVLLPSLRSTSAKFSSAKTFNIVIGGLITDANGDISPLSISKKFSSGEGTDKEVSVFIAKPGRSLTDVKVIYGVPTVEVLDNGKGYVDYGRFRLTIAKDGRVSVIAFPPLK